MPTAEEMRRLVDRYVRAMQAGVAGAEEVVALFARDGVYVEPFSDGGRQTHTGREAIRSALARGQRNTPRDLHLEVERIEIDGERMRADWVCFAPALARPVHGSDYYLIRDGMIARLEVTLAPERDD